MKTSEIVIGTIFFLLVFVFLGVLAYEIWESEKTHRLRKKQKQQSQSDIKALIDEWIDELAVEDNNKVVTSWQLYQMLLQLRSKL